MTPFPEETPRAAASAAAGLPREAAAAYTEIFPLIADKMGRVEREFATWLGSDVDVLRRAGSYVTRSGGKRLRPALVLLSSGMVGYRGDLDVLFGTVFEFIHTATLVHDDIIDEAEVRRGQASLNRLWGNELSVLVGDHLYLTAMRMALRAGNLRILEVLADVTLRMIEGELIQTHLNGRLDVTEPQYLDIIERKTALLFAACCRVPAMLAGRPQREEEALGRYGRELGLAFQVVDDLLDLTSEQKALGKPVGEDIRDGKLTLPLISLLALGRAEHREMVGRVFSDRGFGSVTRRQIVSALEQNGILEKTRRTARRFASRALDQLELFPSGPFRSAMTQVAGFVISRDR